MTISLADLRRLLACTVPKPWSFRLAEDEYGNPCGDYFVLDENEMWVANCGNDPADAALIVAAVNALPLLLDVVEAAGPMRDGHEGCVTEPPCGSCFRCDFDRAVDKLRGGK